MRKENLSKLARLGNILDPISDSLPPSLWNDPASDEPILKPQIKDWLLSNVYAVLSEYDDDPESWTKIILTGSTTSYQVGPHSDVDISVFVNSAVLPSWDRARLIELAVNHLDGKIVPGTSFPLQVYIVSPKIVPELLYHHGLRSGYDIQKDQWIIPPERSRAHDVQKEYNRIYVLALEVADKVEQLLRFKSNKAIKLLRRLHDQRRYDEAKGLGDFAPSNVIWKMLEQRGLTAKLHEQAPSYRP